MGDTCPECGSDNVCVGKFVLLCNACEWHHLNGHPCRECGRKARYMMRVAGQAEYRCTAHPFSDDERRRAVARSARLPLVR